MNPAVFVASTELLFSSGEVSLSLQLLQNPKRYRTIYERCTMTTSYRVLDTYIHTNIPSTDVAVVYSEYVWHNAVDPLGGVCHGNREAPDVIGIHATTALGTAQVRVRQGTIYCHICTEILR